MNDGKDRCHFCWIDRWGRAELHFTNLSNISGWTINHNPKEKIVALTTQLEALKTEMISLKTLPSKHLLLSPILHRSITTPSWMTYDKSVEWKKARWDQGRWQVLVLLQRKAFFFKESVLVCTAFASLEKVTSNDKRRRIFDAERRIGLQSPAHNVTSKTYDDATKTDGDKKTLALSQTLQATLVTHTGMSEDSFQKI